jgi:hypothetical protein
MKNFSLFALASILTFALLQALGLSYVSYQSRRGNWIESPHSKLELLESSQKKYDYILVGASTTQNHFNTSLMGSLGVRAFNLGLPGRLWEEYPSLLTKLSPKKASTVVMSLSPMAFYRPVLCPKIFDVPILSYLLRSKKWDCFFDFKLNEIFPFNQEVPVFDEGRRSEALFHDIEMNQHVKIVNDPRGINYARGRKNRFVITFKNGDGIIASNGLPENLEPFQHEIRKISEMIPENLVYLRELLGLLDRSGFKVVLIIEPRHFNHMLTFDEEEFRQAIGGKHRVIFNNNFKVPKKSWADINHFNQRTADRYTQLITCQLGSPEGTSEKSCRHLRDKVESEI